MDLGRTQKFRSLIAEWDGEAAGYAVFFYFYSTFQGRPALFLEDLYVPDRFRGKGIGKALLAAVAKLAIEENCFGMRWEVLDWNTPAIEFYKRLGADFLDERRAVALVGEALQQSGWPIKPFHHGTESQRPKSGERFLWTLCLCGE